MQFQLVLQFNGDSLDDYDSMVALEDALIQELGDTADLDGHDVGAGKTNIFLFTSDPRSTFDRAKTVLDRSKLLGLVVVAYRPIAGQKYTVLWPAHREDFEVA